MNIEHIAEVCHEANAAYCRTIGDNSQSAWEDAPEWQRESAVKGVVFHLDKLNSGEDPKPWESHESWLKEKIDTGWVYGETKDADAKTHPCCVPYDQLPLEQRMKDILFSDIVKSFWTCRKGSQF